MRSGSNLTSNIFMDSSKVAIASWRTQFLLSVDSDPPGLLNFQGGGWYDSGRKQRFRLLQLFKPMRIHVSDLERGLEIILGHCPAGLL